MTRQEFLRVRGTHRAAAVLPPIIMLKSHEYAGDKPEPRPPETNYLMQPVRLPYARTRFGKAARFVLRSLALIIGIGVVGAVQAQVAAPPSSSSPRVLRAMPAQAPPGLSAQPPAPRPVTRPSSANDAARFLAGMPVSPDSPLAGLTRDPRWIAHGNAMDAAFARLDQRQLSNIRNWQADFLAPATRSSRTCLYFFSGPDFLLPDAFYPDCTAYILVSLETADSIPQLQSLPPDALQNSLQNLEIALNTFLQFGFFETKELRAYSQQSALKGVLPIIFVFLARSGKEILNLDYTSLGGNRGARISFVDGATGARKVLYYITADLSDEGLKRNSGLLRFCDHFGPANSFLKAASYLLHGNSFNAARNYLLQASASILQDDSGIPLHSFGPDKWTIRFFGSYNGPIDLFKNYYQPDLRQYYATSTPKPLTFSFGYQWNPKNALLILAVRK